MAQGIWGFRFGITFALLINGLVFERGAVAELLSETGISWSYDLDRPSTQNPKSCPFAYGSSCWADLHLTIFKP